MKIDKAGSVKSSSKSKKSGKTGKTDAFSRLLDTDDVDETSSVAPTVPVSAVDSLLALQEVDPEGGNRQGMTDGEDMLDLLDEVRIGLLTGMIPIDRLRNLERMASNRKEYVTDPKLKSILQEIEVRAQVELAKLKQMGITVL